MLMKNSFPSQGSWHAFSLLQEKVGAGGCCVQVLDPISIRGATATAGWV